MSEMPSQPPDFEHTAQIEQKFPEYTPVAYIEKYMVSPGGRKQMEHFIYEIDGGGSRAGKEIEGVPGRVKSLLKRPENDKLARFTRVLLGEDGVERLNALEYVDPFRQNPAMTICLGFIERARYDGADDMGTLYKNTLTLLANITRYELLDRSYDPESTEWLDRADRMVYLHGGEHHTLYVPEGPVYPKEQ